MYKAFLIIILSFFSFQCSDTAVKPVERPIASTDKNVYAANDKITVTISTSSKENLHFLSCCSGLALYVDRFDGYNWNEYERRGLPCLALCLSIDLTANSSKSLVDSFSLKEVGTYRFRIPFGYTANISTEESILSNTFTIK